MGLPLPWSVALLLKSAVPPGALSRVALLGENFADEEARAIGLVHEVRDAEGFEAACVARAQEFAEKDRPPWERPRPTSATRLFVRCSPRRGAAREFLDAWFSPAGREKIRQTVEALAKKAS